MNVALVILGAALGFGASRWLQSREETSRKEAVLRLMCATIRNDLLYTVPVTEGLRGNMLQKKFGGDATSFRLLYHPSVILPDSADVARLDLSVVNAFDEYKRRLTECEARRQEYIQALQKQDLYVPVTLLTYAIGLDSVILSGKKFLEEVGLHHPAASAPTSTSPLYSPLQGFMGDLQKNLNEANAERVGAKQVANGAEPGGAANRSQPVGSQTDGTSVAAGSGR